MVLDIDECRYHFTYQILPQMTAQHLQNGCIDCTHNLTRKTKTTAECFRGNGVTKVVILTSSWRSTRVPQNYDLMQTRMGTWPSFLLKSCLFSIVLTFPILRGFALDLALGNPSNSRQPRWQAQQIARAFCATPAAHVSQPWPWNAPSVSLQRQEPQPHATLHTDWLKDDEGVKCHVFFWHGYDILCCFQCIFNVFQEHHNMLFPQMFKNDNGSVVVSPLWLLFWFTILRQAGDLGWFSKDKDCWHVTQDGQLVEEYPLHHLAMLVMCWGESLLKSFLC